MDLAADGVLLRVDGALLAARDVAAVHSRVGALFQANRGVLLVQAVRLSARQLAVSEAVDDAVLLVVEARVHLGAARVAPVPLARLRGGAAEERKGEDGSAEGGDPNGSRRINHVAMALGDLHVFQQRRRVRSDTERHGDARVIDIEALAAPAFLVEVTPQGALGKPRLNKAGRERHALADGLAAGREVRAALMTLLQDDTAARATRDVALPSASSDGVEGWRASLVTVTSADGRVAALLGLCREEEAGGRSWLQPGNHMSLTLQALHGAEWRYDVLRGVYEGSDEIATLIGEAVPRPVTWAEWLERVHPQDLLSFLQRPESEGTSEFRFHAVGGELRWARCSRVAVTDEAGAVEAVLGIMVDITQERVREMAWAELATHDPLTGLLNHRGLRQEVDRLQGELGPSSCVALFAVDLDRFKETNDAHGHAAGDAVLAEAARRLSATLGNGTCARLGGDEFVAVLPVSDEVEAQEMRARLQQAFRRPLAFRGHWLPVSASVGAACGPLDVARLMDDADADLYRRKRAGAQAAAA